MTPKQKKRLILVSALSLIVALAISLIVYALRQNMNLFYTPTQIIHHEAPQHHTIRLGGMVKKGSVVKKDLDVRFDLSDLQNTVSVKYHGILPDLFREGQGIVTQGQVNQSGTFVASQVLAKHDATYMPPEVKAALEKQGLYKHGKYHGR